MKKITLGILSLILSATAAFSFVGCENDPFMGLSAYEVAVQEGFKGTEAEWLASLHGTPGKDGSDLDAKELYESAKAEGYTGTYLEFLKEYLKVDLAEDNDTAQIAENMLSVVSINAYHSGSCWDRNYDWVCRIEGERRVMHIAVIRMYFNWTRNLLYYTIVPRLNK